MPLYVVHGVTSEGRESEMEIQASDDRTAVAIAKERKFFPTKAVRQTGRFTDPARIKLSRAEYTELFTHLELMAGPNSNIQLVEIVGTLMERLTAKRTRALLREVHDFLISSRGNFSEALAQHPRTFPKHVISSMAASENAAELDKVFVRLREDAEFTAEIRRIIRAALRYPLIVTATGAGMITYFMSQTVPKLTGVLMELNAEIPPLTARVIKLSQFFAEYWPHGLTIVALLATAIVAIRRSERFGPKFDELFLRTPVYGPIVFHLTGSLVCQVYRTVSVSNDPIGNLQICADAVPNHAIKKRLRNAVRFINSGDGIGAAFLHSNSLPPEACALITSGEAGAGLDTSLVRISSFYSRLAKDKIQMLAGWVGPAAMLAIGAFIGVVLLAMFLPIANLANQVK